VIFRNGEGGSTHPLGSWTFPAAELRPGDIHSIVVTANDAIAGTFRTVRRMAIAGSDFTASMPPMQPTPIIDAAESAPFLRPRSTVATEGDPDNVTVIFTQRDMAAMTQTAWSLTATRGFIAAIGASTIEVPSHFGLAGYETSWSLQPGMPTQWQHFQNWSSLGVADAFDVSQTTAELDGAVYRSTQRLATITL
jgi:hypothetical protein